LAVGALGAPRRNHRVGQCTRGSVRPRTRELRSSSRTNTMGGAVARGRFLPERVQSTIEATSSFVTQVTICLRVTIVCVWGMPYQTVRAHNLPRCPNGHRGPMSTFWAKIYGGVMLCCNLRLGRFSQPMFGSILRGLCVAGALVCACNGVARDGSTNSGAQQSSDGMAVGSSHEAGAPSPDAATPDAASSNCRSFSVAECLTDALCAPLDGVRLSSDLGCTEPLQAGCDSA